MRRSSSNTLEDDLPMNAITLSHFPFHIILFSMKPIIYTPKETEERFEEKEHKLRIYEVKDINSLKVDSAKYQASISKVLRKVRGKKMMRFGGVDFYSVKGPLVRDLIDDDFVMGGHAFRYLYIPLNEIWIDDSGQKGDWPVIWHEYIERQLMSEGMNYSDAHDTASRLEITLRKGEEFVLPVRHFEQEKSYSCGATALRIVAQFFGDRYSEEDLVKLCHTTESNGTDAKDIASVAKSLGYKVIWKEGWSVGHVIDHLKKGIPMIVNYQQTHERGEGHYSVIIGYTKNKEFIFSDPAGSTSFTKMKIKDFMAHWYELDDNTKKEGIVIYK